MKVLAVYRGVWVARSLGRRHHMEQLLVEEGNPLQVVTAIDLPDGKRGSTKTRKRVDLYEEGIVLISQELTGKDSWRKVLVDLEHYHEKVVSPVLEQVVHQESLFPRLVASDTVRGTTVIILEKATDDDIVKIGKDLGFVVHEVLKDRTVQFYQSGSLLVVNRKTAKAFDHDKFIREYVIDRDIQEHYEYYASLYAQIWGDLQHDYEQVVANLETYLVMGEYVLTRLDQMAGVLEKRMLARGEDKSLGKGAELLDAQRVLDGIDQVGSDWELLVGALKAAHEGTMRRVARRQFGYIRALLATIGAIMVILAAMNLPIPSPEGWLTSIWIVVLWIALWWLWYSTTTKLLS